MSKKDMNSYTSLLKFVFNQKIKYLFLAIVIFCISIVPIIIGNQIRLGLNIVLGESEGSLFQVFTVFFLFMLVNTACVRIKGPLSEKLSVKNGEQLLMRIYDKIYRLPQIEWDRMEKGDVFTLMESDVRVMREHIPKYLLPVIVELLGIGFGYLTIGLYSPPLFFVAIGSAIPLVILINIYSKKIKENAKKLQKNTGKLNSFFDEEFHSSDILRLFKAKSYSDALYRKRFNRKKDFSIKNRSLSGSLTGLSNFIVLFSDVIVIFVGAFLIKRGTLTFGELSATITILEGSILWPLTRMPQNFASIFQQKASFERCAEFLNLAEEEKKEECLLTNVNSISVNNVCFSYSDKKVLQNISFKCRKGEIILIKGPSGSGKTTLMKLLLGLYQPESGEVYLESAKKHCAVDFRSIAYVPQDNFVIDGLSLSENIQMNDKKGNLELATNLSVVGEFSSTMQCGLSTITDASRSLSKGQMQRIAIGRAIYRNSDFMILDEPFSALDERNMLQIKENLKELSQNKGIIVISHREIDDFADRVYTLDRGRFI
ncbi:MAG TPA: ABC transporter ATP-binding protein [Thermotogota bacterium]|nr:ABC transporter ATP-binding protein [Thermotogota bacterium]HPR96854.1 ABC transporter ATP-binding protein [Thermotogota bacterium]